jgi:hypothetical protein
MAGLLSHRDFLEATRDQRVVGRGQILNEATKNTYFFFSRLFKEVADHYKGGTKLVDKIQGETAGSFSFYSPNDEFSPRQVDTLTPIEVNWVFAQSHYVLIAETAVLNAGDPSAYLDYIKTLEQGCVVDTINGLEEALWATPNIETMEAVNADPREPYSILAFITRDGLAPSSTNGGVAAGTADWTTVESVNPSSKPWFRNKFVSYASGSPDNVDTGLIAAFDDIVLQTHFEIPDPMTRYGESEDLRKFAIVTSRDGQTFYKARMRAANDRLDQLNDPAVRGPQYEGVPIIYVSELDNQGWTDNQPDYLFLNLNFLMPFFHSTMYMDEKITDGGSKQPNSTVVWKFSWYNLIIRSRRRQGRIFAT